MKIKCKRCGYVFNPMNPDKAVMQFQTDDGANYFACSDCICELGQAKTEEEKNKIIDSFKED